MFQPDRHDWYYEVAGEQWRGHSGLVGDAYADTASGWSTAKPKNVGKSNNRTAVEQASFEAEAELRKKLAREYRRTIEELDNVPPAPMLAKNHRDIKAALRFHPAGYISVQPKLDGIRMLTRLDSVALKPRGFSRDYQPFSTVDHILEAVAPMFADNPDLILDGELYNHDFRDDFNAISSMVRRGPDTIDEERRMQSIIQYHVYDMPSGLPFTERHRKLELLAGKYDWDFLPLVLVPTFPALDEEHATALYADFLAKGYEGIMYRTDEPYEFGTRSWSLLKRKETIDIEVPIVRLIDGEGNWDGIPKAIEYMLPGDRRDADGNRPKASIKGSMAFCRELASRAPKQATIRYFALTPAGIPRFPVAVDFHDTERAD